MPDICKSPALQDIDSIAANGAVVGVWHYVGRLDLGPGVSDWVPMTEDGECMATSKIGRGGLYIGLRVGGRRVQFHRQLIQDRWAES